LRLLLFSSSPARALRGLFFAFLGARGFESAEHVLITWRMYDQITPANKVLLISTIGVFLLQHLLGGIVYWYFALWPPHLPQFHVWQLVTYAFLHGGWMHLFF